MDIDELEYPHVLYSQLIMLVIALIQVVNNTIINNNYVVEDYRIHN